MEFKKTFFGTLIMLCVLVVLSSSGASAFTLVANYTFYNGNGANSTVANDSLGLWNLNVSRTSVFPYNNSHAYQFGNSSNGSLNSTVGIQNLTINVSSGGMIWYQIADATRNQTIWFNRVDTNNRIMLHYHFSAGGTKRCEIVYQTTAAATVSSNGTASCLADGQWHAAQWDFTSNNNSTVFYYDGSVASTDVQPGTSATDGQRFGQLTDGTQNLTGAVGYSIFYLGTSTASERSAFINSTYTGLGTPAAAPTTVNITVNFSSAVQSVISPNIYGTNAYAWVGTGSYYFNNTRAITHVNSTLLQNILNDMAIVPNRIEVPAQIHTCAGTGAGCWIDNAASSTSNEAYNFSNIKLAMENASQNGQKVILVFDRTPSYIRNLTAECTTSPSTCFSNDSNAYYQWIEDFLTITCLTDSNCTNVVALIEDRNECYGSGSCLSDRTSIDNVITGHRHEFEYLQTRLNANHSGIPVCFGNLYNGVNSDIQYSAGMLGNFTNNTLNAICPHQYGSGGAKYTPAANLVSALASYDPSNRYAGKSIWLTETHTSDNSVLNDTESGANWIGRAYHQYLQTFGAVIKSAVVFQAFEKYNLTTSERNFTQVYESFNLGNQQYMGSYNGSVWLVKALKAGNNIYNHTITSSSNVTVVPNGNATNSYISIVNTNNYSVNLTITVNNGLVATDLINNVNYTIPSTKQFNISVGGYDVVGGNGGILSLEILNTTENISVTGQPSTYIVNITEPNAVQFNLTITNPNNQTYSIVWQNSTGGASIASCANLTTCTPIATGYDKAGNYNITATVTAPTNTVAIVWLLQINNTIQNISATYTPTSNPTIVVGNSQLFTTTVTDSDAITYTIQWFSNGVNTSSCYNASSCSYTGAIVGTNNVSVNITSPRNNLSNSWNLTVASQAAYSTSICNNNAEGALMFSKYAGTIGMLLVLAVIVVLILSALGILSFTNMSAPMMVTTMIIFVVFVILAGVIVTIVTSSC